MIIQGDCLEVMKTFPDNHFSAIVTDPPYGLHFMGKDWDSFKFKPAIEGKRKIRRVGANVGVSDTDGSFLAGTYDERRNDEFQEFMYQFGVEALRICKPGAFMLMCGAPRRFHRQACGLEDAGWEIRDCVSWLYGSGFPKSLNISKAIDKAKGCERDILGIDPNIHSRGDSTSFPKRPTERTCEESGRITPQTADRAYLSAPSSDLAKQFDGFGTALKPAWEPILVCMKPCEGTFAQNAEKWSQAGINIDKSRVGTESTLCKGPPNSLGRMNDDVWRPTEGFNGSSMGRWPSNLLLDEEAADELDQQSGFQKGEKEGRNPPCITGKFPSKTYSPKGVAPTAIHYDSGGASRFFYCPKASSSERNRGCENLTLKHDAGAYGEFQGDGRGRQTEHSPSKNNHPTVKPLKLMEYLVKLIAPPKDALILDPFAGSGTTLLACKNLGIECVGIEKSEEYCEIAKARLSA
jgi:DNA modification methylase